jgi:GxxExxY protein
MDAAYRVHTALGPGLLESVYETCMAYELRKNGAKVQTQVGVPVVYQEITLDTGFRLDLLVDDCVIVELKAVESMHPVYHAQVITYLKLTKLRLGYLINFNVPHLKGNIERIVV